LVIFVAPRLLFAKSIKTRSEKQKKSSWKGELTDKEHEEWEDENSPYTKNRYTLHFKTDKGEQVKINVSRDVYDKWEKGDKAEKKEGESLPVKSA
jgi:hypothetical protein